MKKRIDFMKNSKSGMTMIELVIAVAIFTIMTSMALPSLSNTVRNNQRSGDIVDANYKAQAVLEELTSVVESEMAENSEQQLPITIYDYATTNMGYNKTGQIYHRVDTEDGLETAFIITYGAMHGLTDLVTIEAMVGKSVMPPDGEILSSIKTVVRLND